MEIYAHHTIPTAAIVAQTFEQYGPESIAHGCCDLFGLNHTNFEDLASSQIAIIIPFCELDSNTALLVKAGVHVSVAKRIWLMVKSHNQPLPAKTIVTYVAVLLEWWAEEL